LANQYDIAVLRMFATQGIVVVGLLTAHTIKRLQLAEGVRRVEEELRAAGGDVKIKEFAMSGRRPLWLVERGSERILLAGCDLPQSASVGRAARTLLRESQRMREEAVSRGWLRPDDPVREAVVLLRRRLATQAPEVESLVPGRSLTLINPEGVGVLLARRGSSSVALA